MLSGFPSNPPRRDPWPFDMVAGYQFMLGKRPVPGRTAPLVARTLPGLGADQEGGGFDYTTQNPYMERTHSWDALHLGFGRQWQLGASDTGYYHYCLGVDASIFRQLQLGPKVTNFTPTPTADSTNGISDFFTMTKQYALNGRYALVRNGDTAADWTVSKDFGAGKVAADVVVVQQSTGGSTKYALVGMASTADNFWSFTEASDTTVWAQHATLHALCWAVAQVAVAGTRDTYLFRANNTNQVSRCSLTLDPLTAANWSAENAYVIGDKTSAIVRMLVHPDGTLYFFKGDGVYVLSDDGTAKKLYGGIGSTAATDFGRYNWVFENWIHTTYRSHYRINPGGFLDPVGPERYVDNKSVVKGRITAGEGTPYAAYAGLWNPDTGNSYLMKFGAWAPQAQGDAERIEAWHGSLTAAFGGRKITAMRRSTVGAASDHERLYIGFSDGSLGWFLLPCTPNPANCSSYLYTPASTEINSIVLSRWHGGYPVDNKAAHAFMATGTLTAQKFIQPYFSFGGQSLVSQGIGAISATPGTRQEFTQGAALAAPWTEVQVYLESSTADASPLVDALAMTYHLMRPLQLVYEFDVLIDNDLVDNEGKPFPIGPDQIRANLRELWLSPSITVSFADEASVQLSFRDYEEGMSWDERTQRWRASAHVRAVSVKRVPATLGFGSGAMSG